MEKIAWRVAITWPDGTTSTYGYPTTQALKAALGNELFCLKHGCPLPLAVSIDRIPV